MTQLSRGDFCLLAQVLVVLFRVFHAAEKNFRVQRGAMKSATASVTSRRHRDSAARHRSHLALGALRLLGGPATPSRILAAAQYLGDALPKSGLVIRM